MANYTGGNASLNPYASLQSYAFEIDETSPLVSQNFLYGDPDYNFPEAAKGWSTFGLPGWIRQADILRPIAPILSARDDTFTIRAYGDKRDPNNSNIIIAKAWCEVVVKRTAAFIDPSDDKTTLPFSSDMTTSLNDINGRAYEVVSFRWLKESEI
ncbi:MAG: hypothetical protein ACPGN3_15320 [Opitutales bacterium]